MERSLGGFPDYGLVFGHVALHPLRRANPGDGNQKPVKVPTSRRMPAALKREWPAARRDRATSSGGTTLHSRVYGTSMRTLPMGNPTAVETHTRVPALPSPEAPTPRRRRTIVCSNLTVKGETWTVEDARLLMKDVLKGDKVELRCSMRAGVTIRADYALDVCLSSWCRGCPFAAGNS